MADFAYELKIPKDRIAVLIGKDGEVKRKVEQHTGTELHIDSDEGEVGITGDDPIHLFTCREIVRAVARGFNPDVALNLLKQDFSLEIINIDQYAKSKSDLARLRGRVIGEGGKARKLIEELTDCNVSVYGKTVALLGDYEGLVIARRAVESLLSGSGHANVYRWLEKQRRELKRRRMLG